MNTTQETSEAGSPWTLKLFHAWCRTQVAVFNGERPDLVFGDGSDHEEPLVAIWELEDEQPPLEEFLDRLTVVGIINGRRHG